jgi:hypothetical protein
MRIRVHYAHTLYGLENPQKKNIKVILQINTQIEQIKTCVCLKKTFATYILFFHLPKIWYQACLFIHDQHCILSPSL